MDQVPEPSSERIARVPPLVIQPESPSPVDHPLIFDKIRNPKARKAIYGETQETNPYQPKIPYPSRIGVTVDKEKSKIQMEKLLSLFKQLRIDIGLADALTVIPKFNKWLSSLLKSKQKLEEIANVPVSIECSSILLNEFPKKLGDPERFLIPCSLQDLEVCSSLADSGASINLLPLSIYEKLGLGQLKPTRLTLELANRSVALTAGIAEDVMVKVDKFTFLADFVVVDFEADPRFPVELSPNKDIYTEITDDPAFERLSDEPTLLDPSPPGDCDIIDADPVFERFTLFDHLKDISDPEYEHFTFDYSPVDSVIFHDHIFLMSGSPTPSSHIVPF
ncbi:reverse transcriptase domain-containing protein [Tanacetum coccineum]